MAHDTSVRPVYAGEDGDECFLQPSERIAFRDVVGTMARRDPSDFPSLVQSITIDEASIASLTVERVYDEIDIDIHVNESELPDDAPEMNEDGGYIRELGEDYEVFEATLIHDTATALGLALELSEIKRHTIVDPEVGFAYSGPVADDEPLALYATTFSLEPRPLDSSVPRF